MGRGFFGTRASLVADVNLVVQVGILLVLAVGLFQNRNRGWSAWRALVSSVVALQALLIIAVMNPSLTRSLPFAIRNPFAAGPRFLWVHVAIGTVAELIGAFLVLSSSQVPSAKNEQARTRRVLAIMLVLWTVALLFGCALYLTRYT